MQVSHCILQGYKTIGSFISGPVNLSETTPYSLAVPTETSFKIYDYKSNIKVVSPAFNETVL
jgi:hypothetical protein